MKVVVEHRTVDPGNHAEHQHAQEKAWRTGVGVEGLKSFQHDVSLENFGIVADGQPNGKTDADVLLLSLANSDRIDSHVSEGTGVCQLRR